MKIKFRVWDTAARRYTREFDSIFLRTNGQVCSLWGEEMDDDPQLAPELWTGLTDMNGKEIYEGDIVRRPGGIPPVQTEAVTYDVECAEFAPFGSHDFAWIDPDREAEIIGNIHENPELLTEAKK